MMAARARLEPDALVPYAIVTARNLIASHVAAPGPGPAQGAPGRRTRRRAGPPRSRLLVEERAAIVGAGAATGCRPASATCWWRTRCTAPTPPRSRPGAAPRRARSRPSSAAAGPSCGSRCCSPTGGEPPTDRCRPVLLALSSGERRRQRQLDAAGHLLECEFCAALEPALLDRRPSRPRRRGAGAGEPGRRRGDRPAEGPGGRPPGSGFSRTDATLIATVDLRGGPQHRPVRRAGRDPGLRGRARATAGVWSWPATRGRASPT